MKISIIGLGFVGKALKNALAPSVDVKLIDPILGTDISDLIPFKPDITFICVPTPMSNESSQDTSIIEDVIRNLEKHAIKTQIVIKSTILPDKILELPNYNKIIYNPEFLTEKNANEDFIKSKLIILGGDKDRAQLISKFYKEFTFCTHKDHTFTDIISASFLKYTINTFLATKVIFFNELNAIFTESNPNHSWDEFIEILKLDSRIGDSHMHVPGHDGRMGFGGACFPKDSKAFLDFSRSKGKELMLLKTAISINNSIRDGYNNPTDRELSQNVSFKDGDNS